MYSNPQKLSMDNSARLRREAGHWLKKLREARGLSQRQLATEVGVEYYTFISQLESGRGRIPPDRYRVWAEALGVSPRDFVGKLMQHYDPVTYAILFEGGVERPDSDGAGTSNGYGEAPGVDSALTAKAWHPELRRDSGPLAPAAPPGNRILDPVG